MEPKYYHHVVGGNFRMDALQAAVLRVKAPHLAAWTEARRVNASRYVRLFRDAGLLDRVTLPVEPRDRRHIFNQFVIRTPDRDGAQAASRQPRHRQRDLLSGAVSPAALLRRSGLSCRRHSLRPSGPPARRLALPDLRRAELEQQQAVVDAVAGFMLAARGRQSSGAPTDDGAPASATADALRWPRAPRSMKKWPSVTTQIFIGLVLGHCGRLAVAVVGVAIRPLADAFLRMIRMIIAPLLFSTLVVGIAGTGDLKTTGRIGLKAMIYFQVTTVVAFVVEPGAGESLPAGRRRDDAGRRRHDGGRGAWRSSSRSAWDIFLQHLSDVGRRRHGARRHPADGRLRDVLRRRAVGHRAEGQAGAGRAREHRPGDVRRDRLCDGVRADRRVRRDCRRPSGGRASACS